MPRACDKTTRRAKFPFPRRANHWLKSARLARSEGACARHERCGGMRWTRVTAQTSTVTADGEVAWSWRPDAGVKSAVMLAHRGRRWWQEKPGHQGEHEISRKPSRRESRVCSGSPVALPPCFLLHGAHGCNRHPAFPAPSVSRERECHARLGHVVPRGCELAPEALFEL